MTAIRGQAILEYILFLGTVALVLFAMAPAFKRGVQSVIKGTADQLAVQQCGEQDFSPGASSINSSISAVSIDNQKTIQSTNHTFTTVVDQTMGTQTNTVTNMGFTVIN